MILRGPLCPLRSWEPSVSVGSQGTHQTLWGKQLSKQTVALNTLPQGPLFKPNFLPHPFFNVVKDMLFTYLVDENRESHSWTEPGNSTGYSLILAPSLSQTRLSLTHWNGSALGKGEKFYFKWPLEYLADTPNTTRRTEHSLGRSIPFFFRGLGSSPPQAVAERFITYISIRNFLAGWTTLLCLHLPAWQLPEFPCVQPELLIKASLACL